MMRLRRASAVVALYVLALAATDYYAECTWVLWGSIIKEGLAVAAALDSFQSLGECKTAMHGDERSTGSLLPVCICLPDTVDPRGPKGK